VRLELCLDPEQFRFAHRLSCGSFERPVPTKIGATREA